MTDCSRLSKRAISVRVRGLGSGRSRQAENEAFAMASWCDDISTIPIANTEEKCWRYVDMNGREVMMLR